MLDSSAECLKLKYRYGLPRNDDIQLTNMVAPIVKSIGAMIIMK